MEGLVAPRSVVGSKTSDLVTPTICVQVNNSVTRRPQSSEQVNNKCDLALPQQYVKVYDNCDLVALQLFEDLQKKSMTWCTSSSAVRSVGMTCRSFSSAI